MGRKPNFKASVTDLIDDMNGNQATPQGERPKSARGLRDGLNRFSIVLPIEILDKLRAVAYWNNLSVKEVITQFLESGLDRYVKRHGELKPVPDKDTKLL